MYYLTINAGSSSIKFGLFDIKTHKQAYDGTIDGIGFDESHFILVAPNPAENVDNTLKLADQQAACDTLMHWVKTNLPEGALTAVGHRVVHGGPTHNQAALVTDALLADLETIIPFDPEHLPTEINLMRALCATFPDIPHVASFDTSFHHNLPAVAQRLPIPRNLANKGLRKYGFHGLSYTYLLQKLESEAGKDAAQGRVVLAHMGNGVSLAAVHHGKPIDTTMGLTPAGGVPMSTRSGDLDPGLIAYLLQHEGYTPESLKKMVGFEAGLLGISASSSDMKKLLETEDTDPQAAEAAAVFCYNIKKTIGAYAAAMGGIDTLVFSGGMGEHAPKVRARSCEGLGFLGIAIDDAKNQEHAPIISTSVSEVTVRVIHTDEAITMIRDIARLTQK